LSCIVISGVDSVLYLLFFQGMAILLAENSFSNHYFSSSFTIFHSQKNYYF